MVLDKGIQTAKIGIYYNVYRGLRMRSVLPQRLSHILLFMVYFTIYLPETAEQNNEMLVRRSTDLFGVCILSVFLIVESYSG